MKKLITILSTILTVSALSVAVFAAGTTETEGTGAAAPAAEESNGTEAAAPAAEETAITAELTEKQALEAALKDAGEKEADVTVTKNKLSEKEKQDGGKIAVYTVKFNTNTTSYKYILDANTGAVLQKSLEYNNPDVVFKNRDHAGKRDGAGSGKHNGTGSGKHGKSKEKTSDQTGSENAADGVSSPTTQPIT